MNETDTQREEQKKRLGLVGERHNDMTILAYNLADNKNIRVGASKINDRCWRVDGYVADELRISASVFGGKYATIKLVKFIRNGLTSRVMRRKHGDARTAQDGAPRWPAMTPEEELAETVKRQKEEV